MSNEILRKATPGHIIRSISRKLGLGAIEDMQELHEAIDERLEVSPALNTLRLASHNVGAWKYDVLGSMRPQKELPQMLVDLLQTSQEYTLVQDSKVNGLAGVWLVGVDNKSYFYDHITMHPCWSVSLTIELENELFTFHAVNVNSIL